MFTFRTILMIVWTVAGALLMAGAGAAVRNESGEYAVAAATVGGIFLVLALITAVNLGEMSVQEEQKKENCKSPTKP